MDQHQPQAGLKFTVQELHITRVEVPSKDSTLDNKNILVRYCGWAEVRALAKGGRYVCDLPHLLITAGINVGLFIWYVNLGSSVISTERRELSN